MSPPPPVETLFRPRIATHQIPVMLGLASAAGLISLLGWNRLPASLILGLVALVPCGAIAVWAALAGRELRLGPQGIVHRRPHWRMGWEDLAGFRRRTLVDGSVVLFLVDRAGRCHPVSSAVIAGREQALIALLAEQGAVELPRTP